MANCPTCARDVELAPLDDLVAQLGSSQLGPGLEFNPDEAMCPVCGAAFLTPDLLREVIYLEAA